MISENRIAMNIRALKSIFFVMLIMVLVTGCGKKCPDNYDLENDICVRILEIDAINIKEPYCIVGTLINDKCYMANSIDIIPAEERPGGYYYCRSGYNKIGNMCYPIETLPSYRNISKCPIGYSRNKNGIIEDGINIELPWYTDKCYKRVTTMPK